MNETKISPVLPAWGSNWAIGGEFALTPSSCSGNVIRALCSSYIIWARSKVSLQVFLYLALPAASPCRCSGPLMSRCHGNTRLASIMRGKDFNDINLSKEEDDGIASGSSDCPMKLRRRPFVHVLCLFRRSIIIFIVDIVIILANCFSFLFFFCLFSLFLSLFSQRLRLFC